MRILADAFFAKRYGHRAVVLKTVAAAPGMAGAALQHLRALRRMESDRGWFRVSLSPHTAHRIGDYLEQEAVRSYTAYLAGVDEGSYANVPAFQVAIAYGKLPAGSSLREVIVVIRADQAHHRDVNHQSADPLA